MTCKSNEAVALNTFKTFRMVKSHNVKTLKADNTDNLPEIGKLLAELGNSGKALPFYAIYPPDGAQPIVLSGVITQNQILGILEKIGPSVEGKETATALR